MAIMTTRAVRTALACLVCVVVAVVGGCSGRGQAIGAPEQMGGIPVGQSSESFDVDGHHRTVHLYRPAGLDGPAPLVVMLHGGYGDGAQAERSYNWDTEADSGRFVVAYPDGVGRAWNAGTCCGTPKNAGIDDVGFLSAMVSHIGQQMPIDTARVYATGMSNGAMMTLRLGCQTELFAAIAPVAGTLVADCSQAKPTSVLQIHGTADDRVPFDGGPGKGVTLSGTPMVDGPSVVAVNNTWRAVDNCDAPTSATRGEVSTQIAACPDARTVELITIAGAGHQWPGGQPSPLAKRITDQPPPSTDLDATHTIWQFFASHHR